MRAAAAGLVVATALVAVWSSVLQRGGPAHESLSIGDGIPATLYLPGADGGPVPYPRPEGERPPVVVLAHGYGGDQAVMSPMARSFAEAGYAVVTFDFRGHGSNTDRFAGELAEDVSAVVDWAEASPLVDGPRLAVVGHSMGAGAVLDFATQDDRPLAVVPVSGGRVLHDAVVPSDVLLVAGLAAGLLPAVVGLVLPLLVGLYLVLEVFAATCYARSRSPGLVAVTESIVIAWLAVTLTPIG